MRVLERVPRPGKVIVWQWGKRWCPGWPGWWEVRFMANVLGVTGVCGRVTYFVCIVWRVVESTSPRFGCNWLVTVTQPLASGDSGIDDLFFSLWWMPPLLLLLLLCTAGVGVLGTLSRGSVSGATELLLACWIGPCWTWGLLQSESILVGKLHNRHSNFDGRHHTF